MFLTLTPQLAGIIIVFLLVSTFFIILSMHRADKEWEKQLLSEMFDYQINSEYGSEIVKRRQKDPIICMCGDRFHLKSVEPSGQYLFSPEKWECPNCKTKITVIKKGTILVKV